jgi:hypothetical protein
VVRTTGNLRLSEVFVAAPGRPTGSVRAVIDLARPLPLRGDVFVRLELTSYEGRRLEAATLRARGTGGRYSLVSVNGRAALSGWELRSGQRRALALHTPFVAAMGRTFYRLSVRVDGGTTHGLVELSPSPTEPTIIPSVVSPVR